MTIQELLSGFLYLFNDFIVPALFALATLFFLWNAARYFIIGGASEEGREKAKQLALWGILALVIMVSIWGIVNILVGGLGFDREGYICPDYLPSSACPQGPGWEF